MRKTIALLSEEAQMPEDSNQTAIDEIVESPEAELSEVCEIAVELDEADAAIEEGSDTAETLDAMSETMQRSVEEGTGIDPIAAEAIKIAVEHMTARIGLAKGKNKIAVESFRSKTTRLQATKIALEGIQDTIKEIFKAIANAFSTAIEWVKKFFTSLFDSAVKVGARADKVLAAAKEKEGNTPKSKKLESPSYAQKLRYRQHMPDAKDFVHIYTEQFKDGDFLTEISEKKITEFLSQGKSLVQSVKDSAAFDEAVKKAIIKNKSGKVVQKSRFSDATGQANNGLEVYLIAGSFLGDKALYAILPKEGLSAESLQKLGSKQKYIFADMEEIQSLQSSDMEPLMVEHVIIVAETTKKVSAKLVRLKSDIDKMQAKQKEVQNELKASMGSVGKDMDPAMAKNVKIASEFIKGFLQLSTTVLSQLRSYEITTCNAALSYCAASLAVVDKEGGGSNKALPNEKNEQPSYK